ncbi:MAG: ABC transporter ATP-binding protein [Thermotogaceae bacterium]|nr:ABC transporter ATP-binding protein [Thermotogaceae bacterium]
MLKIEDLHVSFGGVKAVDGLNMNVEKGTLHALIGPNGAGKTTVFNAINGIVKKDSGRVIFKGMDITMLKTHRIASLGISRVFQNPALFKYMTVLDNILVGFHSKYEHGFVDEIIAGKKYQRELRRALSRAYYIADILEIKNRMGVYAANLPYGVQKMVELGRALMPEPSLLLLDEPAAGLSDSETRWLLEIIERIRNEMDITVIMIEHDMKLVMNISDVITVMDFGKKIAEGKPNEIRNNPEVLKAYLGGVKL